MSLGLWLTRGMTENSSGSVVDSICTVWIKKTIATRGIHEGENIFAGVKKLVGRVPGGAIFDHP